MQRCIMKSGQSLTILFPYTELIIPPRCRKARYVNFDDGVFTTNIPCITAEQAPVAIRATFSCKTFEYRWYKERLWTAESLYRGKPVNDSTYRAIEPVIDLRDGPASNPYILNAREKTHLDNTVALDARLKDIIIIDGQTYCVAGEPVFTVCTFGLGNNHGGTSLIATDALSISVSGTTPENIYGLMDIQSGIDAATKTALERGDTRYLPIIANGPLFEILINEAVKIRANSHFKLSPEVKEKGCFF